MAGRYSDDWHRVHLTNPRDVVPESNMPAYAFLANTPLDNSTIQAKMNGLRMLGHPYTDAEIADAPKELEGKTEMDAVIAYLQSLGRAMKDVK
jgi:cytochrome c oxidase cbb3-type subunit 2